MPAVRFVMRGRQRAALTDGLLCVLMVRVSPARLAAGLNRSPGRRTTRRFGVCNAKAWLSGLEPAVAELCGRHAARRDKSGLDAPGGRTDSGITRPASPVSAEHHGS